VRIRLDTEGCDALEVELVSAFDMVGIIAMLRCTYEGLNVWLIGYNTDGEYVDILVGATCELLYRTCWRHCEWT
jgi:hypothetical protein